MKYVEPEMEIVMFKSGDVIATSENPGPVFPPDGGGEGIDP